MTDEHLLWLCYLILAPAWVALIAVPAWSGTRWLCRTGALSLALSALYLVLVLANVGDEVPGSGVWTLDGLALLFSSRAVVLIGWVHYLAFDLFVGTWVATDGLRAAIPRPWMAPCLLFVLIMGPIGLLLYLALRRWRTGTWAVFPAP